jgi:hypothetical protein
VPGRPALEYITAAQRSETIHMIENARPIHVMWGSLWASSRQSEGWNAAPKCCTMSDNWKGVVAVRGIEFNYLEYWISPAVL